MAIIFPLVSLSRPSAFCATRAPAKIAAAAKPFVYRNPGGDIEDMQDLQGRPYRKLPTAFLYRTEYLSSCKCQPDPWEAEAKDRHRGYALADAARRGSKDAQRELQALHAKLKQASLTNAAAVALPFNSSAPASIRRSALVGDEGAGFMRLGVAGSSKPRANAAPERPSSIPGADWARRVFESSS
jgi:hypothetical protein